MRIGVVGDIHEPFVHPMYRRFCIDTFAKWKVNHVHFIGDIVDLHALSQWDHDPDGRSAGDECKLAEAGVKKWHRTFNGASVSIGNHDERHFRLAKKNGMASRFLKDYANVWSTPTWDWRFSHRWDGVLYEHGTGSSGKDAAINRAIQKRTSLAMGHVHCWAGVKWHTNEDDAIFGMNVGCGVDPKAYAFEYGKAFAIRPVLGCGVVIDGEPHFLRMQCGRGEKYHRRRAGKRAA